ncbi:peptidoglycan DD-metalloendopeptidase family protein [Amorphus sp. MBR-141]
MFSHVSNGRGNGTVGRAVAVTLVAAFAAGCSSDVSRFTGGPIYAGSTPNQQSLLGGSPDDQFATGSLPGTSPSSAPLQQQSALSSGTVGTSGPVINHKGWSTAGGTTIVAQYGDTIDSLSRRYGVPADVIAVTNRLTPGTQLQPGSKIVIPTYSTNPAVQSASTAPTTPAPAASAPGTYTVKPGDTVWSIARATSVTPTELLAANGISSTGTIRVGQTLKIPGGAAATPATVATGTPETTLNQQKAAIDEGVSSPAAEQPKEVQVASLPSEAGKVGAAVTQTDATDQPAAKEAPPTSDGADGFRWPVRGRIVSGFGKQSDGANNDGINLAVPEGTPIKAAEKGTVIYAGNELQGYGNLVLIQHKDGWVSAYAHAEELLVKRGETVQRGQVIAKAGTTGSVSQPQLHFELRKGSQPVDPLPHLSGA